MRKVRDGQQEIADGSLKNILPEFASGTREFSGVRKSVEIIPAKARAQDGYNVSRSEDTVDERELIDR